MRFKHLSTVAVLVFAGASAPKIARAQDDGPVDIEVGSSRIGGPGTTAQRKQEAAWDAAAEEEATPMTEETLPPKGDKKRIPALHKLARQYLGGKMWKDCCDKYDQILEEGSDEGLNSDPDGKKNAARSYYECAQIAFFTSEYNKAERLLQKSEKYGPSDHRHAALRHKMSRETYHRSMANGDIASAITEFKKYQAEQADEDERIWMGEELAKHAWSAYTSKDKIALKEYLKYGDDIAPKNTELRRLKAKIEGEENVLPNVLMWSGAAVVLVVFGTQFSKWRARAKIKKLGGGEYSEGLDEEV